MYSTEYYTQYLVMTYNGNESNKEYTYITYVYIYMYNWLTLLYYWNLHNIIYNYKSK